MRQQARPAAAYSALRWPAAGALGLGGLGVICYGLAQADGLQSVAVGLLVSLAAASVGALLGFVFGIPRRVENSPVAAQRVYAGNTNLEQISDWIVKIIVALGLIELGSLTTWFGGLSRTLGAALGSAPSSTAMAAGTMAFFAPAGFLTGYLWARTAFTDALDASERALPVAESLTNMQDIATRMVRQASSDIHMADGSDGFDHREPVRTAPPHQIGPTTDLVMLWREIEDVLAGLLYPLDGADLAPDEIIGVLQRRGVLEPRLAQTVSHIAEAARQAAAGARLDEQDETAVRMRGAAAVSDLAKLRRVAPRLFERHVLRTLTETAEASWQVSMDPRFGDVSADALVTEGGRTVVVEVKVLANRVGGRVRDLLAWLDRLPPTVPVLLVLAGDRSTTPDLPPIHREGAVHVLMWDTDTDRLANTVSKLLAGQQTTAPS
jgi:hypothetical protein